MMYCHCAPCDALFLLFFVGVCVRVVWGGSGWSSGLPRQHGAFLREERHEGFPGSDARRGWPVDALRRKPRSVKVPFVLWFVDLTFLKATRYLVSVSIVEVLECTCLVLPLLGSHGLGERAFCLFPSAAKPSSIRYETFHTRKLTKVAPGYGKKDK